MAHGGSSRHEEQKARFERGTSFVERLIKHTGLARTMRAKMRYIADELVGCGRVLEVGTGRGVELGVVLDRLGEQGRYVGIDLAAAPLRATKVRLSDGERERVSLAVAAVERLPFQDRAFDGVFCIDVLHHAASQPTMLSELRRILRPGGKAICVEPNPLYPVNVIYARDPIENQLFKLTDSNARQWVAEAGLTSMRLFSLPIYFPSFPSSFAGAYGTAERVIGAVPGIRRVSTTRVLVAERPASTEPRHG